MNILSKACWTTLDDSTIFTAKYKTAILTIVNMMTGGTYKNTLFQKAAIAIICTSQNTHFRMDFMTKQP